MSVKTSVSKNLKKLENSIKEFKELENMNLPEGGLVKIASESQENIDIVKAGYNNKILVEKFILVDRNSKVEDLDKSVDDLNVALEAFYEKWQLLKQGNSKLLRGLDTVPLA